MNISIDKELEDEKEVDIVGSLAMQKYYSHFKYLDKIS